MLTGRVMSWLGVLALAVAVGPAAAQDFNAVAPRQPAPQPRGSVSRDTPEQSKPPAPDQLLLPKLSGLRIVDRPDKVVKTGVSTAGLDTAAVPLLNDPRVTGALAAFLGKPLTVGDLQKISDTLRQWFAAHDLPVVDIAFPEQDISSGTLQVVVTVYRLGQVKVEGNRWFRSDVLVGEMRLARDEPINLRTLSSDLDRLNRNPFRSVSAVLARSDTIGDTDVVLHVQDRIPLRLYAAFDNEGVPSTSRDRYSIGFNWGNVFSLDQQLSYQFMTSPDLWQSRNRGPGHSQSPRFMAHSVSYLAPLPGGRALQLFGAYVEQVPNVGTDFDQVGHSLQLSMRLGQELPGVFGIGHQLELGFDYKRTDNNLAFGGTQIYAGATTVEQFVLAYEGSRADSLGQTSIGNQLIFSPGGLSSGNRTSVFVASGVTGAKADYLYDHLTVQRMFPLPLETSMVLRAEGQVASTELLPSEPLGAGGSGSVRGYDPRVANGSQGLLASLELHSPPFRPLHAAGLPVDDAGELTAFFDSGFVSDIHAQPHMAKSASLESAGLELRYGIGRYLDVRADYGWQLARTPGSSGNGSLATVSVTLSR